MDRLRLRELRERKELTQADVARQISVDFRTIGNYEAGRREPDIQTIKKLCEFFEVTADYLLGIEDI